MRAAASGSHPAARWCAIASSMWSRSSAHNRRAPVPRTRASTEARYLSTSVTG
jgi:hypothetical protein